MCAPSRYTAGLPFRKVQSKAVGMGAIYGASLFAAILISTPLVQSDSDTCYWTSLRAASIRGALYANGGFCLISGTGVGPIGGDTYSLDYSKPFNTIDNTDFTTLFTGPTLAGDQMVYYDGTMFATDDAFYLFGYVQQAWPSQLLTSLTVVNLGRTRLSLPTRPLDIKPIPQHQGRQSRARIFL